METPYLSMYITMTFENKGSEALKNHLIYDIFKICQLALQIVSIRTSGRCRITERIWKTESCLYSSKRQISVKAEREWATLIPQDFSQS